MAWRLHQLLKRGEFDFTVQGRISGVLWLAGAGQPVRVDLKGTPSGDLAGHRLTMVNPRPVGTIDPEFPLLHQGVPGDMTASRKVRLLDDMPENADDNPMRQKPLAWHWGNAVYLEWFSESAGRVVIESASFEVTVEHVGSWQLTPEAEARQQSISRAAMTSFLDRLTPVSSDDFAAWLPAEEEPPASAAEAQADAEDQRMEKLMDRVTRRLKQTPDESPDRFLDIYEEEREKLRKELGEPDPKPLSPEQEQEQSAWIDELNHAAREALEDMENDPDFLAPRENHPLVEQCRDLSFTARSELLRIGCIRADDPEEHPLQEWLFALQCTSAKLAGALNPAYDDDEWPPDPIIAGSVLVRLKKARAYLRDAHLALRAATEDESAPKSWIPGASAVTAAILTSVEKLITEVRAMLDDNSSDA